MQQLFLSIIYRYIWIITGRTRIGANLSDPESAVRAPKAARHCMLPQGFQASVAAKTLAFNLACSYLRAHLNGPRAARRSSFFTAVMHHRGSPPARSEEHTTEL